MRSKNPSDFPYYITVYHRMRPCYKSFSGFFCPILSYTPAREAISSEKSLSHWILNAESSPFVSKSRIYDSRGNISAHRLILTDGEPYFSRRSRYFMYGITPVRFFRLRVTTGIRFLP